MRRLLLPLTASVAFGLSACGGQSKPSTATLPFVEAASRVSHASKSHPWLYVSGTATSEIYAYDIGVSGTPPVVETITTGVDRPDGLAIDPLGTLYVMNGNNTVTAYPDGATTPSLTLSVQSPVGVAVDTNLDVWVITRGSPPSLFVYHRNQTSPYKTIMGSLFKVPSQIVFDAAENLYISDNDTGVSEIVAGTFTPKPLNLQGLPSCPTGVALDNELGDLFVSGCDGATLQYKVGRTKPKLQFNESFPADNVAIGLYQGAQTLFLPNLFSGTVYFYNEAGEEITAVQAPVGNALGVAYKRAGL